MREAVLLIGVGNEYRSDDAVGLLVAREFARRNLPDVAIVESTGEGASLLEAWKGADRVVIVDAVSSGAAPGMVHRIIPSREKWSGGPTPRSSHAFGVAEAIETARVLLRLPPSLTIVGIEGSNFAFGTLLSPPVAAGFPSLLRTVEDDLLISGGKTNDG